MNTFYDRLLQEKAELDERKDKLTDFINSGKAENIDPQQKALLRVQATLMEAYSEVLTQRLSLAEAIK